VWSVCGRFVSRWRQSMCACIEKCFLCAKIITAGVEKYQKFARVVN
jgi:hypothetical protein